MSSFKTLAGILYIHGPSSGTYFIRGRWRKHGSGTLPATPELNRLLSTGEQKHLFHHTHNSWLSIPKVTLYYFQQASRSYQCPSYQTITAMWSLTLHQKWLLWLILLTLSLFRLDSKQLCSGFRNSLLDYVSYCSEIAKPMWLWKELVLPLWFTKIV